jgi:hypothetical protein
MHLAVASEICGETDRRRRLAKIRPTAARDKENFIMVSGKKM